jgi:ABC-type glycerol-3-phosphate transport system substrate-binding protein
MPVPPQPQRAANPTDFWNNFGNAADRNPQEAWKYLNAAQQDPEIFRQKLLVME